MRWRSLVLDYLHRKQAGRCLDCGAGLRSLGSSKVGRRVPEAEERLEFLKLVHMDCKTAAVNPGDLMRVQIELLLSQGRPPSLVASVLGISERTVWRYKARRRSNFVSNGRDV